MNGDMAAANQEKEKNGDCEGSSAMYIKLISSDGHEFIIKKAHALLSGTIKAMLTGPGLFTEKQKNEIHFQGIPSHILAIVCKYFAYKDRYAGYEAEIPEFPIPPQFAIELLMASNFLEC